MIFGLLISYARALSRENKKVSRYRKSNFQISEKPSKLKLHDEAERHGWEQNELQKSIINQYPKYYIRDIFFLLPKVVDFKYEVKRTIIEAARSFFVIPSYKLTLVSLTAAPWPPR